MTLVAPDLDAVLHALDAENRRVVGLLRAGADLGAPVPGLAWSAGELAAHLSLVYGAFASTVRGETPPAELMGAAEPGGTLPEYIAATNRRVLKDITFPGAEAAADALEAGAAALRAAVAGCGDADAPRPTPWYGPDVALPATVLACLSVTETLVHGFDLDRAAGRRAGVSAASAATAVPTVMSAMLPRLVDPGATRGVKAAYELRIRGGRGVVVEIDDGTASSAPADGRPVDCVVSLAGDAALLIAFGRRSVWRAMASGGALAFGRKPWLGPRFPALFLTP